MWSKLEAWYCRWPPICHWIPPVVWMLLIFCLSAQPKLPEVPVPFWDTLLKKGAHVAAYAVLLAFWWRALTTRLHRFSPLGLAWVLTVLYAASDEFHQTFVPGRHGNVLDVLIDGMGASLAACAVWWATRLRE